MKFRTKIKAVTITPVAGLFFAALCIPGFQSCGNQPSSHKQETSENTKPGKETGSAADSIAVDTSAFKSHSPCSFGINLPADFTITPMYEDSGEDYCDFSVTTADGFEIMQLHSMANSRFEFSDIKDLYRVALGDPENEVIHKTQKENWFVIIGTNKENGNAFYWKRIRGENFVSDMRIEYPKNRAASIERYIPVIAASFTGK